MPALTAPFLAAAGLLAVAGVLKLRRPAGTRQALRTQGLPSSAAVVRLLGALELAVAAAAIGGTRAGAAALAVAYAGFTGFVALALVRGRPLTSCGCFAEPDLPPTWAHVGVTAALAAAAAASTGGTQRGLPAVLDAGAGGVAVLAAAALVGWLCQVVLAELPRLTAATAAARAAADQPVTAPPGARAFALTAATPARSTSA